MTLPDDLTGQYVRLTSAGVIRTTRLQRDEWSHSLILEFGVKCQQDVALR